MRRAMPLAVAALVFLAGCTSSVSEDGDPATDAGTQVDVTEVDGGGDGAADGTTVAADDAVAADAAADAAGSKESAADAAKEAAADVDAGAEREAAEAIAEALDPESGRAFDATDEMVVETILRISDADSVEWHGSTVEVHLSEGSAAVPTAGLTCLGYNALIAAEEKVVIVFQDGEVDCDEMR